MRKGATPSRVNSWGPQAKPTNAPLLQAQLAFQGAGRPPAPSQNTLPPPLSSNFPRSANNFNPRPSNDTVRSLSMSNDFGRPQASGAIPARPLHNANPNSQGTGGSQDEERKRSRTILEEDDIDVRGQLKVAVDRTRQLQDEVARLQAQLKLNEVQQMEKIEKTLEKREAALSLREKEIEEQKEILQRSLSQASRSNRTMEQPIQKQVLEEEVVARQDSTAFSYEVKTEILVLLRFESSRSPIANVNREPISSPIASSPLTRSRMSIGSPVSPLSVLPASASATNRYRAMLLDTAMERDLSSYLSAVDESYAAAGSLMQALGYVYVSGDDAFKLLPCLSWFLKPEHTIPMEIAVCALRVMSCAAKHFISFCDAFLQSADTVNLVISRIQHENDVSFDVSAMKLFIQVVKAKDHGSSLSFKNLAPFVQSPLLASKAEQLESIALQESMVELISLLLRPGSDAVPYDFPSNSQKWKGICPPFFSNGRLHVGQCFAIVASHGEPGVGFLMHHGLLSRLVDHMYHMEVNGKPDRDALALLLALWEKNTEIELTSEEEHRLTACLLSLRDRVEEGPGSLAAPQAEYILRSMNLLM